MPKYDSHLGIYFKIIEENDALTTHYSKVIEKDYLSGLPEIEIAATFYKNKIDFSPDPTLPDGKKSDLIAKLHERDCYFEITAIIEHSKDVIRTKSTRFEGVTLFEIPTWEERDERDETDKYLLDKIVSKVMEESIQLPEEQPNVLIINIEDPFVSKSDVLNAIMGIPNYVFDEMGNLRVVWEEFKPFRTLEELLDVLHRVSAVVVYRERDLKNAIIGMNDSNSKIPLTSEEKKRLTELFWS